MNEDHLSVELGRLIDAVKAALPVPPVGSRAEAVAVLTVGGFIYSGGGPSAPDRTTERSDRSGQEGRCSAAAGALSLWRKAGEEEIAALALASAESGDDDPLPCRACGSVLMALDPDLPLVVKRKGRWVAVPLGSVRAQKGVGT